MSDYATIKITGPHGSKEGDTINNASTIPEHRWWPLIASWLLRRPPPMRVSEMGWTWIAGEKDE